MTVDASHSVTPSGRRLTQFAAGGGCACKIPVDRLEALVAGLPPTSSSSVVVGVDHGDDAAVVRDGRGGLLVSTADFFTPMVDDPFTWGEIAAANALSDVYAMGGEPLVAINLVAWPTFDPESGVGLPDEVLGQVLHGGASKAAEAECPLVGGHSITGPEPVYGLAVTGRVEEASMLRNDAARPGLPLTLTKPVGVGILNNRMKATGQVSHEAIAVMSTLNREASRSAVASGAKAATDVTGFGLLGHLFKLCRASGVRAVLDVDAVPLLEESLPALREGWVPGGSRRNLDWVRPHCELTYRGGRMDPDEALLLLADAQTSGGLLVVGEMPGYPVIGYVENGTPGVELR